MCLLCNTDEPTRYFDLYIVGSEGLNVCHDCEMKIVEFCRDLKSENSSKLLKKAKNDKYWKEIGWKKFGIDLDWNDLIGERILVQMSPYATEALDRIVERVHLDFVYFKYDNNGYAKLSLKLIRIHRSDKFFYGYNW